MYHDTWLDDLYERAIIFATGEDFIEHGWGECLAQIDKVEQALQLNDRESDPSKLVGAGWVAEEAFATALYCFLLYPNDPMSVIRRGAATSGDSDSIACIAGAFAGAYKGRSAIRADWIIRIEYHDQLESIAVGLANMWA